MKKNMLLACLFVASTSAFAQAPKPGTPVAATSANTTNAPFDIRDRLVELALKNPGIKVRDFERDKAVAELNKAGASWLNYVTVSSNLNEVSLGKYRGTTDPRNSLFYPLWNVGISVPLGSLVQKGSDVRVARRNLDIASAQQESAHRQIKAMILSKYHDYLMNKELLTIQNEVVEDDYAIFSQAEAKLATGGISYEEYSSASKKYNDDRFKKMNIERDLNVVKLEIEEIIGMKLDDVLAQH
ncbi:TolC family protein [Chitinophaga varians]|uniref:TolC family protein n=1 Tax=Chitinophaga varians TaxID=2202339 RepID=UPI00165FF5A6|nr:TolC family protein [Chitinophaga varians]MBC9915444.1 TolC family protein [Chitinophaga varians]